MSRKMKMVSIALFFLAGGLNLYAGLRIEPKNVMSILSGALLLLAGAINLYEFRKK